MATVATLTRVILVPNLSAFGYAVDQAVPTLLAAINAQPITVGPAVEQTRDNQYAVITVSWPSTSDTAFVSGGTMASVASSLGLSTLGTWQVSSTSAY